MNIYVFSEKDITVRLFFNKNYEYQTLAPIMEMMRNDSSLHFIDIGANQGFYTLPIATLARHIVAVEAIDEICERNYASQYANKLNKYVTLVNNAISDSREIVDLIVDLYNHSGISSIMDKVEKGQKIKQVKSILMDDLLEVIDFKKAILKMDIDGGEARALRGANELFSQIDIPMVLMEWYWHKDNPSRRNEIIKFFKEKNYEAFSGLTEKKIKLDFLKAENWPWNVVWIKN